MRKRSKELDTKIDMTDNKTSLNETGGKKSLMTQIIRFGFVGGTSFIIDYLITLGVSGGAGMVPEVRVPMRPPERRMS